MILSFDPGYTTGVVLIGNFRRMPAPDLIDFDVLAAFAMPWADRLTTTHAIISNNRKQLRAIVCERFKLFAHEDAIKSQIGSEMPSSRVIGAIELSAQLNGLFDNIVFQETWERKQVRVLAQHMPAVSFSPHTFDAYTHAHYYARTHWETLL